jgi:hypothetical protein
MPKSLDYYSDGASQPKRRGASRYLIVIAVLATCLLALRWLPHLVIRYHAVLPGKIEFIMFFLPQMAFPYDSLVGKAGTVSVLLSALQWGSVAIGLMWLTGPFKLRYVVLLTPLVIMAVAIGVFLMLALVGLEVQLDGP